MKGAQREAAYRAVNPMMALPALIDGEGPILFKSLANIEYLDETHPKRRCCRATPGAARVCGDSLAAARWLAQRPHIHWRGPPAARSFRHLRPRSNQQDDQKHRPARDPRQRF